MDKVLELKKKIHAFKNGLEYINKTKNINNEALHSILKTSIAEDKKMFKNSRKRKTT